jgi:K+/H+ antiporter YhaU regulatory subunit KhtT
MLSIISLLIVLTLSILVTRIATVALAQTGLSRESARFQARSAFTGVGFTTNESEKVVNHPVRRKILLLLMLLGNAGIVTAITSLILSFVGDGERSAMTWRILLLVAGLVLLWALASSQWIDQHLSRLIGWALNRYTKLEVRDFAKLLRLTGDYAINELQVQRGDWMADRSLQELRLRAEGVAVLGITRRDGAYIGAPDGTTILYPDDTLILYGRGKAIAKLDKRRKGAGGEEEHDQAIAEQEAVAKEEKASDEASQEKMNHERKPSS